VGTGAEFPWEFRRPAILGIGPVIVGRGRIRERVCVLIFRAGTGGYGVMPATDYDGDAAAARQALDVSGRGAAITA
jgi:hypothetical protein